MRIQDLYDQIRWVCWGYRGGTKVPISAFGGPASSTDSRTWSTYQDCAFQAEQCGHDGVGLVLVEDDDIFGIDLDDCLEDSGAMNVVAGHIVDYVASYTEVSPSGKGVKILARCPELKGSGTKRRIDIKDVQGHTDIEVYPSGRFFTITGEELSGTSSEINIVDLEWLQSIVGVTCEAPKTVAPTVQAAEPETVELARKYVATMRPSISGSGGHNNAFRVAHRLVVEFGLDEAQAFAVMSEWNLECEPPWSDRDLRHKIKSAIDHGDYTRHKAAVSEAPVEDLEFDAAMVAKFHTNPIPEDLLDLPGMMGEFAAWVTSQNHRRNPVISMLSALSLQALITSRKIVDTAGTRTNLYLVGIAPSSGGKQAALDCIRLAVDASSNQDRITGKVTSDAALTQQLERNPATLCLWDEFGLFLQKTGKSGHLQTVQEALLDLWNAGKTSWRGKTYADAERDVKVVQPALSFLGMTTPGHFWTGLTKMHLRDGFAGRMMVIDTGPRAERGRVIDSEVPEGVLKGIAALDAISMGGNLADAGFGTPKPLVLEVTEEAEDVYDDFIEECDAHDGEIEGSVWGRAVEKSRKLGLIYASASGLIVDVEAATWATRLSRWATRSFLEHVEREVQGGNDRHSEVTRDVIAVLSETGMASKTDLLRKTGAPKRMLDEVVDTLSAAGRCVVQPYGRGHRVLLKG